MRFYVICGMGIALGIALYIGGYYRTEYKKQLSINGDQATEIQQLTDTLNDQNTHIDMLHEMETKHIRELDNAKSEIDTLRADVAAGRRKLLIKAICPVHEATSPGGMVDATTIELTGETGSTVLDIREGIINDWAKLRYLQEYVKTECLR
ncbi:putative Rac prophage; prophage lambda endopeptidase [Xenorhabdus bovienii str. oregonense]|uniref:Putative Rac prophage prophage lambda endopeptidase n=1 Tax=Xenorhabdus bovienii str. oregonense TaxID=1398202 RepID=A0A077P2B1_XENBV|nr:lysis protein [Xenorhabdus bovienii]CDH04929.1 putative Rac prophage; prophage lambda endopeptidase [Xenorhabdus bovienii str. oregonense]